MSAKAWLAIGAFLMACGVALGAFGAHVLREVLTPALMAAYEKALFYHLIHGLAVVSVASLAQSGLLSTTASHRTCILLLAGVTFFSGSLYLLALSGQRWLGAITPLGGILLILAWLHLCLSSVPSRSR